MLNNVLHYENFIIKLYKMLGILIGNFRNSEERRYRNDKRERKTRSLLWEQKIISGLNKEWQKEKIN